jgi:hypothetical protein
MAAPGPTPVPWEALEALAAGETPPEAARALRARIASDPALARRWRRVARCEAALARQETLPLPLPLLARLRDAALDVATPAPRPWVALRRFAGAAAAFAGLWVGVGHAAPALAEPAPALVRAAVADLPQMAPDAAAAWTATPTVAAADLPPAALAGAGVALAAAGLVLARRWRRGAA